MDEDTLFCTPLTNLKVIRDASSLQLCRLRRDARYSVWARLNFLSYEGMVTFYCTFVAMKRQDQREVPDLNLLDHFELESDDGEKCQFGGEIQDGEMRHALRLFRDQSSGGVRIEASALRGPLKDVPIWTAFVTRYVGDPDWPQWQSGSLVSLVSVHPAPRVFSTSYEPPRNRLGEYTLLFTTTDGMFQDSHRLLLIH